MSQHDYVIDNSTGANVRSDINSVLQAIATNNSGSSAPSATFASQFFADTSAGIMKLRNTSNNGYVNLFTLAGGIDVDAASNFNEDVTFTGASDNIVFDKSDNAFEFADNAKAKFGNGGDLEIFHNGTNNVFDHIAGSSTRFMHGNEKMLIMTPDSHIELYFDNSKKFATTSTGVQISGTNLNMNSTYIDFSGSVSTPTTAAAIYRPADNTLAFSTANTERLRITNSGLSVTNALFLGSSNSHNSAKIVIQSSGNTSATNSVFFKNSDETESFRIRNDGVFFTGIDGASPYNLTSSDSANVVVTSSGSLRRSTSSVRYKKDIADATFGLADVLKLKPKTFKNNATGEFEDDKTYAGFTAEDIHDLGLTEFVQYNEANQPDALAYGNMVALMAKAIQELNAKVEKLEAA